jgi:hypothetical protein
MEVLMKKPNAFRLFKEATRNIFNPKKKRKNKGTFLGQTLITASDDAIAWHKEEKKLRTTDSKEKDIRYLLSGVDYLPDIQSNNKKDKKTD